MTTRYNFLIADDIIFNRFLLKEIVSDLANQIHEAQNGQEAIELLKEHPIDIILMDIEMPVMNGMETTRYIREELDSPLNKTTVIALTAHNPSDFFKHFQKAGFDHLITKPYSIEKIKQVIHSLDNIKSP
jgi:CheY-like chemotaxis protein